MVIINKPLKDARGAAVGSGGTEGILRVLDAANRVFKGDSTLDRALTSLPTEENTKGRANAIFCSLGAREKPELCRFETDRAGHGLAISAVF
ncbi:MAG: hypothetical protein CMM16_06445 [Rhodospirillaceae bacterium]|nr:hypothetical protein [Rhodospirillaceae bacterium]